MRLLAVLAAAVTTATASVGVVPPGMGPIGQALKRAKSEWHEDACVSRVEFRRQNDKRGNNESFIYTFYSRTDWREDFSVRYYGGELSSGAGPKSAGNRCVGVAEIDVKDAVAAAVRAGMPADYDSGGIEVVLDIVDAEQAWAYKNRKDEAPYRRLMALEGKTFWIVSNIDARFLVIVDAVTGKVLMKNPERSPKGFVAQEPPARR